MSNEDYRLTCVVCGMDKPMDYVYQKETSVCDRCAEIIANHWWESHAGKYLTWPNPANLLPNGRRKAKISSRDRWTVFERDDFRCRSCGSRKFLEVDHIIAEAKGGPSCIENYQTLCNPCNLRKGCT